MARRLSIPNSPILPCTNLHLIDYPTPSNSSYWRGLGPLAGIRPVIQLLTGVFLAMHYAPHADLAPSSVEHIMRDVPGGRLIRYMHANGASLFFMVVHSHISRGLYYASHAAPRESVWISGVVLLFLMIATASMGYVLPRGQMSFWGATVITSLASAPPVVGETVVTRPWGGFSVDNATPNRFFSLHYLLPFLIVGATIPHLATLHQFGSNNPLGVNPSVDKIAPYPYPLAKDLVGRVAFAISPYILVFLAPNPLGHPDNHIPGGSTATTPHCMRPGRGDDRGVTGPAPDRWIDDGRFGGGMGSDGG